MAEEASKKADEEKVVYPLLFMKTRLPHFLTLLVAVLLSCADPCTRRDEGKDPKGAEQPVSILADPIYALYCHDGPPATIDRALGTVVNPTKERIDVKIMSASFIEGTRNESGEVTVRRRKMLALLEPTSHSIQGAWEGKFRILFRPVSVEISYHDNYQAIRIEVKTGGKIVGVDAELHVEREDPYPED